MDNDRVCQAKTHVVWDFFLREAKIRLLDAQDAVARKEWRAAIRSLKALIRGNVKPPSHHIPPKNVQMGTTRAKQRA